jgi:BMFP domain-containing protein YqiC
MPLTPEGEEKEEASLIEWVSVAGEARETLDALEAELGGLEQKLREAHLALQQVCEPMTQWDSLHVL